MRSPVNRAALAVLALELTGLVFVAAFVFVLWPPAVLLIVGLTLIGLALLIERRFPKVPAPSDRGGRVS